MPVLSRRARVVHALLPALLLLSLAPLSIPVARATVEIGGTAVVTTTEGDHLALREGPGREYAVLTTFPEGTVVSVLDGPAVGADGTLWYQVAGAGLIGWCWADFLAAPGDVAPPASGPGPTPAPPAPAAAGGGSLWIGGTGGEGARLRDTAGLAGSILLVIPDGAAIVLTGATRRADDYDWAPVRYGDAAGWIVAAFLTDAPPVGGDTPQPGAAAPAPATPPPPATLAPATILAPGDHAMVVESNGLDVRIRGAMGSDAPILDYAPAGSVLLVVNGPQRDGANNDWYGINYDGVGGWVASEYLAPTDAALTQRAPAAAAPPRPLPTVAASPTPSQVQPAVTTPSPTVAPTATPRPLVTTTAPAGSTPAATPSRQATSTVSPTPAGAPASVANRGNAVVAEALRYLGAPYLYGGATPAGWDCSGFIFYVYKQFGVTLPRSTQAQYAVGQALRPDEIKAGDIVYFANTAGPGITHNGIALGDGRFVHARDVGFGTVISSLADSYWSAHYAGARRP